jgi:FkbM family methyltransferase
MVPWLRDHDGVTIERLPIPDDSVRAEAIEYFAILDALDHRASAAFTMMELGASYGPWTCVGALLAQRAGATDLSLTAVEASSFMCGLVHEHLRDNAVTSIAGRCAINVVQAAVARESGTLYFPKVTSAADNGGQASAGDVKSDYMGREVEHEPVPAKRLTELMPAGRVIDFMHVDIQGHEFDVLGEALSELGQRVRRLFIGTHSRLLEGQLLEALHRAGWELQRERPTRFRYQPGITQVTGWTTRDGGQYWRNPRLS